MSTGGGDWTVLCDVDCILVGDESSSRSIDSKRLSALTVLDKELPLVAFGLRKKSKSSALTVGAATSEKLSPTDDELALLVGEGQCHLAGCKVPYKKLT